MTLERATITNLQTGNVITVMFNPEEYSLDEGNAFAEIGIPGLRTPPIQYVRGNARVLQMELFFDTYETRADVRSRTGQLVALLNKDVTTQAPPILLFSWGSLNFQCVLESVGQRFLMFLEDGTPVRARLTVSFKEYEAVEIETQQGLFIGPTTLQNTTLRVVRDGETLSHISAEVLGDPGAWRVIADANNLTNPLTLEAGLALVIPHPKMGRPR